MLSYRPLQEALAKLAAVHMDLKPRHARGATYRPSEFIAAARRSSSG